MALAGVSALSLLLVCVSGCRSSLPGTSSLPVGASPLSQALAGWASFPVNATPRPLVLVGPSIDDPAGGFTTGDLKLAYIQGAITSPASTPSGPSTSQGFHLITAADAFHKLTTPVGQVKPPVSVPPLVTTAVRLGSATFQTDRGTRQLPAWTFSFDKVAKPAAVLAVIPRSTLSPKAVSTASSGIPFIQGAELNHDGAILTVNFVGAQAGTGPCTADYSLQVDESATAVAVQVDTHPHGEGANCTAVGYDRQATTTLRAPVGPRIVADATSGQAVAVTTSP
jgi:hypothetical protein